MINSINSPILGTIKQTNEIKENNNKNTPSNVGITDTTSKVKSDNNILDESKVKSIKESNISPVSSLLNFNKIGNSVDSPEQLKKDAKVLFDNIYKKDPENFKRILSSVYGQKDPAKLNELLQKFENGELPLPDIKFISSDTLKGANGAYSSENGGTIYLNESLKGNKSALLSVIVEETGHHFDKILGDSDTEGDEGQMLLASINKGEPLNEEEMSLLKQERDTGKIVIDGKEVEVEFALPLVAIWVGRATAATTVDAFLEVGIGAITGTPPGLSTLVEDAMLNLIPGLGEGNKVKNVAKLTEAIDKVIDVVKAFKNLKVPGSGDLIKKISACKDEMLKAVESGNLKKAQDTFKNLIGAIREVQVASSLEKGGAKIVQLGKDIKDPVTKELLTEIDVISEEAGKKVFNQVKSGNAVNYGRGSKDSWAKFTNQVDRTIEAAKAEGASVKYYVDKISDEALEYLTSRGIQVIKNADLH